MEVLQVQAYNNRMIHKWHKDYAKNNNPWSKPQLAMYTFSSNGQHRKTGYVAFGNDLGYSKAVLRPTKQQAIMDYKRK